METPVTTVLGPISSSALGVTLIHEHLKIAWLGWEMDPFNSYDRKTAIADSIRNMVEVKELGVSTVVDPTPMGLGRDPEFHAEVAQASCINLIIPTGLDADMRSMPPDLPARPTDPRDRPHAHEFPHCIEGTGSKARHTTPVRAARAGRFRS